MDIRKLQRVIVDGLEDVKAQNIVVFNTEHLSPLFERVIVASGTSNRQTRSLAASVRDAVKSAGAPSPRTEGEDNGEWIIVDCGAAVVHVMQPAIREYYHLEELWGEKPVRMKIAEPTASRRSRLADRCRRPPRAAARCRSAQARRQAAGRAHGGSQVGDGIGQGGAEEVGAEDGARAPGRQGAPSRRQDRGRATLSGAARHVCVRRSAAGAARRVKIVLVAVGPRMPAWADAAFADFAKRMPPELRLELKAREGRAARRQERGAADGRRGDAHRGRDPARRTPDRARRARRPRHLRASSRRASSPGRAKGATPRSSSAAPTGSTRR